MEKQEYFDLVSSIQKEMVKHRFRARKDRVTECSCGYTYEGFSSPSDKMRRFSDHVAVKCAMAHRIKVEA